MRMINLLVGWGRSPGGEIKSRGEKQGDEISVCGNGLGWGRLKGYKRGDSKKN